MWVRGYSSRRCAEGQTRLTQITLRDVESLPQLRDLLANDGAGQANIHLMVPLNDNEMVEIGLKGDFALSPATITAIQSLSSVESLRDV